MYRLEWKSGLIQAYEQQSNGEAVSLAGISSPSEYQKITSMGRFEYDKSIHLSVRLLEGRVGVHVLTPFKTHEGKVFLVNRGWAPSTFSDNAPLKTQEVTIKGIVVLPKKAGRFTPVNVPASSQWYHINLEEIGRFLDQKLNETFFIELSEKIDSGKYPIPVAKGKVFKNNHLGYALTWYSLALCVLIYTFIFAKRKRDKKHA